MGKKGGKQQHKTTIEKVQKMALSGMLDKEIAAELDMTATAVTGVRHRYKIPSGKEIYWSRALKLVRKHNAMGLTDAEIASATGVARPTVRSMRRRLGLAPGLGRGVTDKDVEKIRAMAEAFKTDPEIAEELGLSRWVVPRLRQRHGIQSGLALKTKHIEEAVREGVYRGLTDVQIAREYGLKHNTINATRNKLNLKPRGKGLTVEDLRERTPRIDEIRRVLASDASKIRAAFSYESCPVDEALFGRVMAAYDRMSA